MILKQLLSIILPNNHLGEKFNLKPYEVDVRPAKLIK